MDKPIFSAVIIEDNELEAKDLKKKIVDYCSNIRVEEVYLTGKKAVEEIPKLERLDVLFADWDLGPNEMNAPRVIRQLLDYKHLNFEIVFVTGHAEQALAGYDFDPLHFLVKPVKPDSLREVNRRLLVSPPPGNQKILDHLMKIENIVNKDKARIEIDGHLINPHKIYYCKVEPMNTLKIATEEKDLHVRSSLSQFRKKLRDEFPYSNLCFCQPDQSTLLNRQFIQEIKAGGEIIFHRDNKKAPDDKALVFHLNRAYRKEFISCFKEGEM